MDVTTMSDQQLPTDLPTDFEQALASLEQIVARMESGELPLEQSLQAYEQGVKLAQVCQQRLDHVEQQVQVLQGQLMRPFTELESEQD
ncbi:exodeoxyribonuclease VII small subunit [Paenalcaligenes faecalis]|uniref:exodeoxyribonuclease VII small subunit n=2 Tax=Paenalcaligenes TaxID=1100891 RepID=UPI0022B9910C|nr:exodeoxyribonuclease VII small subunit [Paenalcaligenes faecalis]